MHCHFNCCGSGCDFGIVRCVRTRLKKDTVSRSLTKLNVTNIKRCDHICVCVIILHRLHWRPPSSAFMLPVQSIEKSLISTWFHGHLKSPHAIICAIGPSTVWQLPPTTFWWPVIAPRPHSSLLVFYEPCRGSPWSCPSRSPAKKWICLRDPEAIFSLAATPIWQTNTTGATLWGNVTTHLHYFISLL